MSKTSITRRSFLKSSLAFTGLTIAVSASPFGYELLNASENPAGKTPGFSPNAWFTITPDNKLRCSSSATAFAGFINTPNPDRSAHNQPRILRDKRINRQQSASFPARLVSFLTSRSN